MVYEFCTNNARRKLDMSPTNIGQTDGGSMASEADSEEDKEDLAPVAKQFREQIEKFKELLTNLKPGSKITSKSIKAAMVSELEMAMETDEVEHIHAEIQVESNQNPHVDAPSTSTANIPQADADEPSDSDSQSDEATAEEIEWAVEKAVGGEILTNTDTTTTKIDLGPVRKGRSTVKIHFENIEPTTFEKIDPSTFRRNKQIPVDEALDEDLLAEAAESARKLVKLTTIKECSKDKEDDDSGQNSEQSGNDGEIQSQDQDAKFDQGTEAMEEEQTTSGNDGEIQGQESEGNGVTELDTADTDSREKGLGITQAKNNTQNPKKMPF